GDWEGWLRFFLRGVAATAREATATARRIIDLRDHHQLAVLQAGLGVHGLNLLTLLYERPILNVNVAKDGLNVSYGTANKLVDEFEKLGLLEEISGRLRNRRFRYTPYLALFEDAVEPR